MSSWKNVIAALGFAALAAVVALPLGGRADAQEQGLTEAQAWEIYHGAYNDPDGAQDDTRFYVVRHNRLTGETQYIGCEDRDGCTQLQVEIQEP